MPRSHIAPVSLHPGPPRVYLWLRVCVDRSIGQPTLHARVRQVAREFSIPQAVAFMPDSCASLQWTEGTLHLYGHNINLNMWISALGALAASAREEKSAREEQEQRAKEEKEIAEAQKVKQQMEAQLEMGGFSYPDDKVVDMTAAQKKAAAAARESAWQRSQKEELPALKESLEEVRPAPHRTALCFAPLRSAALRCVALRCAPVPEGASSRRARVTFQSYHFCAYVRVVALCCGALLLRRRAGARASGARAAAEPHARAAADGQGAGRRGLLVPAGLGRQVRRVPVHRQGAPAQAPRHHRQAHQRQNGRHRTAPHRAATHG